MEREGGSSDVWWKTVPQTSGCNRKRSVADSGQLGANITGGDWMSPKAKFLGGLSPSEPKKSAPMDANGLSSAVNRSSSYNRLWCLCNVIISVSTVFAPLKILFFNQHLYAAFDSRYVGSEATSSLTDHLNSKQNTAENSECFVNHDTKLALKN